MLVATILVGLCLWEFFSGHQGLNYSLSVPLPVGIASLVTLVVVTISYFVLPPQKLMISGKVNYLLILATIELLVVMTHGVESAFLSVFVLILGFAMGFGAETFAIGVIAFISFTVYAYLVTHITPSQLVALSALGTIPLLASALLWGHSDANSSQTKEDRSYHELASELSQVASKSEVVINAITDGVLALNGQGIIELINPAAQQLIGWGKQDALNLTYKSVFKMVDSKTQPVSDANDPVTLALATNKPLKNDSFSLQTNSGKTFLAAISVSPVGQLGNGVIVVFRDVTTEKSDERQRAEFISTASHEMRTPVASIEGYLGLSLNPATATIDEKARDYITKAHESAQHLGRLFTDLLDVSKADDSRLKNDPKIVDVVPFIHDIVEGLTPKAVEKGLRILYKPLPDGKASANARLNPVYYANVDNDHLREVTQNLVENAIKYTLAGDVVIDVTGDNDHIVISIADTGIGIPKEDMAHLFQKFYRVDNSDTREIGGTGLGLYLCRRLTETIGGRIWLESEYKKGSTFFVEIPRTSHDDAQRLIEQASVYAEQEAILEQQQAAMGTATSPAVGTNFSAPSSTPQVTAPQYEAIAPQPPSAPVVAPQYTPAPSAPVYNAEPVAAPVAAPQPVYAPQPSKGTPVNTPLSAIEANPSQYINRQTPGISVPPRQQ